MNGFLEFGRSIVETYGYAGIFWLTLTEQFIQPLPADIFIAMGTAAGLEFNTILWQTLVAAFVGSIVGYYLGKYLGLPVIHFLFSKKTVAKGEKLMEKYGVWAVVVAALTPIPFKIFTWLAGMLRMDVKKFTIAVLLARIPRYLITATATLWITKTKFYASTEASAIILGALQGVSEFLPISSSGHLAVMEHFLVLPVSQAELELFDIFLHGGSLLAIVIYFWKDWVDLFHQCIQCIVKRSLSRNSLLSTLFWGTVPVIIAGLMFASAIGDEFRQLKYVATAFTAISFYFLYAEWKGAKASGEHVNLKQALTIGAAQALAIIPGVSRAGTTISTGLLLGIKRETAARFSFMLGGIAILAANVYAILSLNNGASMPDLKFTLIGATTSFLVSLASISWLLKYLRKNTLRPFAVYLMVVGGLILLLF